MYERQYLSPRPPPKISLKHDHNWTKGNDQSGSTVEHQPVGKLVQQSLGEALQAGSSKPTQSKPIDDRTGKPVTQEIVGKLQGGLGSSDRTGKPVEESSHKVQEVGSLENRDNTSSNANKFNLAIDNGNIDFNISGVPNAIVKRSHGINVHNLISRSRITLNDKHFKVIFNNIKHLIPSAKNQKMRLWLLGTLNYAR